MAKTSEDIERLLNAIEFRQVRCPGCGGVDANVRVPYYDLAEVRFQIDGTVSVGETYDTLGMDRQTTPIIAVCHKDGCGTEWALPDHAVLDYSQSISCECSEARQLDSYNRQASLSEQGPLCEHCSCTCVFESQGTRSDGIPFGRWTHVGSEQKCAGGGPIRYAKVTLPLVEPGL